MSIVLQHESLASIREENVTLRARSQAIEEQLGQARQESLQLAKIKVDAEELKRLQGTSGELLRLRGEKGLLLSENAELMNALGTANAHLAESANSNATPESPLALSFPTATARDRGSATLPATLQTATWAALNGNPENICRLEGLAATEPDGTPAQWTDRMVQFYQNLFKNVASVQVIDTTPRTDGTMDIQVNLNRTSSAGADSQPASTPAIMNAKHGENGWQIVGWTVAGPPDQTGAPKPPLKPVGQ